MGLLERYSLLYQIQNQESIRKEIKEPDELEPIILPDDSTLITLAEYSPECKEIVRVHSLGNYRKRPDVVVLVPNLKVEMDYLIFDREELTACLPTL